MLNILKIPDADTNNLGKTQYILYPENIYDIHDLSDNKCQVYYAGGKGAVQVGDYSARKFKRYIQEGLDESIGFLKAEYTYNGYKGVRYCNVAHIAAVLSHDKVDHGGKLVDMCSIVFQDAGGPVKIYHPAHEVAYQIRRVMKRLDQDQEICCAPEAETEE